VWLALLIGRPITCAAQNRWQVQLNSGRYLYDLRLIKLEDTSLVVEQTARTVTVPVREINQLVLVQGMMQRAGARGGAHDLVHQLTLLSPEERLTILR
jgi:hypothetical protein